jgi:hypothetical protein
VFKSIKDMEQNTCRQREKSNLKKVKMFLHGGWLNYTSKLMKKLQHTKQRITCTNLILPGVRFFSVCKKNNRQKNPGIHILGMA